jgi:hypothetical protein
LTERSAALASFASAKTHAQPKGKTKTGKHKLEQNAQIWEQQIANT